MPNTFLLCLVGIASQQKPEAAVENRWDKQRQKETRNERKAKKNYGVKQVTDFVDYTCITRVHHEVDLT